jgi:GPH family glycoside/pentoside/hexuronide:cation symporter
VEQSETAITGIKLMISIVPGILYMSCALFLFFYPIDQQTEIQMQEDLEKRKGEEGDS